MDDYAEQQTAIVTELLRERSQLLREESIRRTLKVLDAKRRSIREELEQLILHMTLLIPLTGIAATSPDSYADLLQDAIQQLEDDAFARLLLQVLQEVHPGAVPLFCLLK
jgi:hypothetical protein